MDIAAIAAQQVAMQMAQQQQEMSASLVKMALQNETGAAVSLTDQAAEQAKAASVAASNHKLDILA